MKTFGPVIATIILLCFAVAGCKKDNKKDETKKNFLKVDGTEYDISKGYLEYYGAIGPDNNIDLTLFSPGITVHENMGMPDSLSGNGHTIYFEMYTSGSGKLAVGDYSQNNSKRAGSFDFANYVLNWDIALDPGIDLIPITSGTVKVTKSDTEYELSFSGRDENNRAISGYYKGSLKFYTIIPDKKSHQLKRAKK